MSFLATPAPMTPWPLGMRVTLGNHPEGRSVLASGWAKPEGTHIWNSGPESEMRIVVAETNRALKLDVTGIPLIHERRPFQDITLFVNGFRLGFWRLRQAELSLLSATIAPEQMAPRGSKAGLEISWHIPLSVSPSELNAGSDSRELGFCFHTLSLS